MFASLKKIKKKRSNIFVSHIKGKEQTKNVFCAIFVKNFPSLINIAKKFFVHEMQRKGKKKCTVKTPRQ